MKPNKPVSVVVIFLKTVAGWGVVYERPRYFPQQGHMITWCHFF